MTNKTGIDLVDWRPDYTKSKKENDEAYRQAYRDAYGVEPPAASKDFDKRLKAVKSK